MEISSEKKRATEFLQQRIICAIQCGNECGRCHGDGKGLGLFGKSVLYTIRNGIF